jgi:hypothetical protein
VLGPLTIADAASSVGLQPSEPATLPAALLQTAPAGGPTTARPDAG